MYHLLLYSLLYLLSYGLVKGLLLHYSTIKLHRLMNNRYHVMTKLRLIRHNLLLIRSNLNKHSLNAYLSYYNRGHIRNIVHIRVVTKDSHHTNVSKIRLQRLNIYLHLYLLNNESRKLNNSNVHLHNVRNNLNIVSNLCYVLLTLLYLYRLHDGVNRSIRIQLYILRVNLKTNGPINNGTNINLYDVSNALNVHRNTYNNIHLLLNNNRSNHLLSLVNYHHIVSTLYYVRHLLNINSILRRLHRVNIHVRSILLLNLNIHLNKVRLNLYNHCSHVNDVGNSLLLLSNQLYHVSYHINNVRIQFHHVGLNLNVNSILLLNNSVDLNNVSNALNVNSILLHNVSIYLYRVHYILLLLSNYNNTNNYLLLKYRVNLNCIRYTLNILRTISVKNRLLLMLISKSKIHIPAKTKPTKSLYNMTLHLGPKRNTLNTNYRSRGNRFKVSSIRMVTSNTTATILPITIIYGPVISYSAILYVRVVNVLTSGANSSVGNLHYLIRGTLLLLSPLPAQVSSMVPYRIFNGVVLANVVRRNITMINVYSHANSRLMNSVRLKRTSQLTMIISKLRPPSHVRRVIGEHNILKITSFNLSNVFNIRSSISYIVNARNARRTSNSLLRLHINKVRFHLYLISLLLHNNRKNIYNVLYNLNIHRLCVNNYLNKLNILSDLLHNVRLNSNIYVHLLNHVRINIHNVRNKLNNIRAKFNVNHNLLLHKRKHLNVVRLNLYHYHDKLHLFRLKLTL